MNDKKIKYLQLRHYWADHDANVAGDSYHKMGFSGWSDDFFQQIKDGGRQPYWIRKMLIYPYWITPRYWMKIKCAQNLVKKMQHGHTEMLTWPKTEPEVNSNDVICSVERRQEMWVLLKDCTIYRPIYKPIKPGTELNKRITIKPKHAKFTFHHNPRWRRPPYWISKMSVSPDWMKVFPLNLMDRCVTFSKV